MTNESELHKCSRCEVEKPHSDFYCNKSTKSGTNSLCKCCDKKTSQEYRDKNKEAVLKRDRKRYHANKEIHKARQEKYQKDNKEKVAKRRKQFYQDNKATIEAGKKIYRENNKEKVAKQRKITARKNSDTVNMLVAKRKAQKILAIPKWADIDEIKELYTQSKTNKELTGLEYHVDHIVPLQSKLVCGLHVAYNLQVLTAKENMEKSNIEWPNMP